MYAIYGNIYHQYTPNVSIYTIHGSYGTGNAIPNRLLLHDSMMFRLANNMTLAMPGSSHPAPPALSLRRKSSTQQLLIILISA